MSRMGNRAPSRVRPTKRVLVERRAICARLAALTPGSVRRGRGRLGGENARVPDPIDGAQESVAKDLECTSREILLARLRKLARAEEKIREGTYGRCDACGEPIPAARHQAVPEAIYCVSCAEERERRRAVVPVLARPRERRWFSPG